MTHEEMRAAWDKFYDRDTIKVGPLLPVSHIDPDNELCWRSMAVGFFTALGADVNTARELADQVQI